MFCKGCYERGLDNIEKYCGATNEAISKDIADNIAAFLFMAFAWTFGYWWMWKSIKKC